MTNPTEVYSDGVTQVMMLTDTGIAKITFSSAHQDKVGNVQHLPVLVLTMPVKAIAPMMTSIAAAVQGAQQKAEGPTN